MGSWLVKFHYKNMIVLLKWLIQRTLIQQRSVNVEVEGRQRGDMKVVMDQLKDPLANPHEERKW